TEFDASFILITRPGERLSEGEKAAVDTIVARSIDIWDEQTQGLGRVDNRTASDDVPNGGDEGPDPDGGSDAGPVDGTAAADPSGSAGDDTGDAGAQDGDSGGCGCGPGRPAPTWVLVLGLAGWRRRLTRRCTMG
ncbi:MAG: hypothetical protein AAF721_37150, partial [Myxococcota bacterium]